MHLVTVLSSPSGGGRERVVLDLLRSAPMRLFEHTILFTKSTQGSLARAFQQVAAQIRFVPVQPLKIPTLRSARVANVLQKLSLAFFRSLLGRELSQLQPDVVHSHTYEGLEIQARQTLLKAKCPWIFTLHGTKSPEKIWKRHQQNLGPILNNPGAFMVCVSHSSLNVFSKGASFPLGKTCVIHNGIDLDKYAIHPSKSSAIKTHLGIPADAVIVGSVGRLNHEKGHTFLVEAAAQVTTQRQSVHFVLIGDGPLRSELEASAKRHGISDRTHFVGEQDDVRPFLSVLDVFVLPSVTEGLPLALLEALASGVPCIATDVGGNTEVLRPEAGIIVPPRSSEALAQAIKTMLDPTARRQYNVPPSYIQEFSLERCAQSYVDLYHEALAARGQLH